MKIQVDRITDLGTFLYEIGNSLEKEGAALQSLARTWHESGDPHFITMRQFGIDISDLGEQLMALKKQLCTACLMKQVTAIITISADKGNDDKEKQISQD